MLASGLGEARSVCPSIRDAMLIGGSTGLWESDGEGRLTRLWDQPVEAVTAQSDRIYALSGGVIFAGPWPAAGQPWAGAPALRVPAPRDLQADCAPGVLIATATGVERWDGVSPTTTPLATDLPGVRALALAPDCGGALTLTAETLWQLGPTGRTSLATGLVDARAVATDLQGRVWVVQGAPSELGRVEGGVFHTFARYLGDPRDLHFGIGAHLLPADAAYLADGEGTLDYVRLTGG